MNNLIVEKYLSEGLDYIDQNMIESFESYVINTVYIPDGIKELKNVIELLKIIDSDTPVEKIHSLAKQYNPTIVIIATMFSKRFKELTNDKKTHIY
jgi:predicted metallopeptidase